MVDDPESWQPTPMGTEARDHARSSWMPLAAIPLLTALAMLSVSKQAWAQNDRAEHVEGSDASDAVDFQNDAILAMPNDRTPVPQDNTYATPPGAEQRAEALEANPDVRLTYTNQLFDSNVRFSGQLRYDGEYFGPPVGDRNVDFLRLNARVQYVDPNNDQNYSPYFAFAPRWSYDPFFAENIANRQDLNLGVQKRFNFDRNFVRVPEAGRTGSATTWSLGFDVVARV